MKKLLMLCMLGVLSGSCLARDSTADDSPPEWFTQARQALEMKKYDLAVTVLNQSDQKSSADWHNLMGYSLRKKTPPDLPAAEKNYQMALEKDPKHRGALEYYGELLLLKNDLPGAEALLQRLGKVCFFGCEELSDLKKSVADYKAKK